jgi:hypothetical protein
MASLLDDLKREIAGAAKPLIVCGAGVSKAANPKAPDWRALIESGIDRVVAFGLADEEWGARQRQALKGKPSEWIGAANQVTDELGGRQHSEFREWLRGLLGEGSGRRTAFRASAYWPDSALTSTRLENGLMKPFRSIGTSAR